MPDSTWDRKTSAALSAKGESMVTEDALWALVHKWNDAARERERGPYLNADPSVAFGQALNTAAEDLSDLILDSEDAAS
jgi:hypothetical protein